MIKKKDNDVEKIKKNILLILLILSEKTC